MIERGCSASVFLFWLERRDPEMIPLAYYETLPQQYFLRVRNRRKSFKTLMYFNILITWPISSTHGHYGTATLDAAITVSCKDQQKTTSVHCTADVHRVVVSYHRNRNTAQSISSGIWSNFKTANLQPAKLNN